MKLRLVCLFLLTASAACSAIDRNAFTFTNYNLNVRVEPDQQRLAVRGRVTLRNDSSTPQKNAVLQISSSLDWRSIQVEGKPVQFVSQPYASDIDHTGALSEAIVTLPIAVAPKASIDINVGYEGVIVLDTTRLKRIGVPDDVAKHSDWDQISPSFSAVRGVGYIAWYPVAMDAANLSEGNSAFEILGRWKARHAESSMSVVFSSTSDKVEFSGTPSAFAITPELPGKLSVFSMVRFGRSVPAFTILAGGRVEEQGRISIHYLAGHESAAEDYLALLGTINDATGHFGRYSGKLQVFDLPEGDYSPFVTESMALVPLNTPIKPEVELSLAYASAKTNNIFQRAWAADGLAHFEQAAYLEQKSGRNAALKYMGQRLPLVLEGEKNAPAPAAATSANSLLEYVDESFCGAKAMYVWWMLRDMLGRDTPLTLSIDYRVDADRQDPSYIQHLLERHSKRDLQWFFDDWVYHDHGLPDFRVAS